MARIAGVDLPRNKTSRYRTDSNFTVSAAIQHHKSLTTSTLTQEKRLTSSAENEVSQLRDKILDYKIEGDLRREVDQNIKRLMDINSYRGLRHRRQLPVRGQRTNTNARTRKGKARTISVGRKAKEAGRKSG